MNTLTLLPIAANLSVGGLSEGRVEQEIAVPSGNRNTHRVEADDAVAASFRRHGRDSVCAADANHALVRRHRREIIEGAAVIAAANSSESDAHVRGAMDRLLHSERHADLTHHV